MTQLVYRPLSVSAVPLPVAASAISLRVPEVFELSAERWDRWIAKGVEHNRLVRRRFLLAACILAVVAVVALSFRIF